MMTLSGPLFEPQETELFKSLFKREGAHYNIFSVTDDNGMNALRCLFPEGKADDLNFCLFSTSGVHGSYVTVEDVEAGEVDAVTFLIIQPRLVCMRYGNCIPQTDDDFVFLKSLRRTSREVIAKIGG